MELRRVSDLALRIGLAGVAAVATGLVGVVLSGNPSCGGYGDPDLLAAGAASACTWGGPLWRFLFGAGLLVAFAGFATAAVTSVYRRVATPR